MNKKNKVQTGRVSIIALALLLLVATGASAGDLTPAAAPTDAGSALFTLEDLYNRLNLGTAGSRRGGAFTEPSAAPGSTMHNLNDIMGKMPAVNANGAADGEVLTGKAYWGLTAGQWGPRVGTMANVGAQNVTPSTADQTITQGYHDGTGKVAGDVNLVPEKIADGVAIFGVTGTARVATGDAGAAEVLTGKTFSNTGAVNVSGTMANVGAQNVTPSTTDQAIIQGYHDGTGKVAGDANLVTGNIKAGTTIFGVTGKTEVVDTTSGDAAAGEILNGKKAWVAGAEVTGTLETKTLSAANDTVAAGNYAATTLSTVDTDLVTGNIKAGTTIFGVTGKTEVIDTTSGDAVAGEILNGKKAWVDGNEVTGTMIRSAVTKTGQTSSYLPGDDGELQSGLTWPSPRFTDNGNGTVTDNMTGLIWLKDANFSGFHIWDAALTFCHDLADGSAGLSDGSSVGDWRLPNINELMSLVAWNYADPAVPNTAGTGKWSAGDPFSNIQSNSYWTSTVYSGNTSLAWQISFASGETVTSPRMNTGYVWPVRGP